MGPSEDDDELLKDLLDEEDEDEDEDEDEEYEETENDV